MRTKKQLLKKDKYLQMSKLGTDHNLAFSSCVVIGDKILGLDGVKRKLLVSDGSHDPVESFIIELDKVKAVSMTKEYSDIKPGDLPGRRIEEFLKTIQLRFEYHDKDDVVTFYQRDRDGIGVRSWLEKMSRNWQIMLSKIVGSRRESQSK